MRILLAVDGSAPSQDAIDEVAERSWPASSTRESSLLSGPTFHRRLSSFQ